MNTPIENDLTMERQMIEHVGYLDPKPSHINHYGEIEEWEFPPVYDDLGNDIFCLTEDSEEFLSEILYGIDIESFENDVVIFTVTLFNEEYIFECSRDQKEYSLSTFKIIKEN